MLFGSWYTAPIIDRVVGNTRQADLDRSIEEINRFEKMLADEGALILKFWFPPLEGEAKARLQEGLEKDPKTRWRVTPLDWERVQDVRHVPPRLRASLCVKRAPRTPPGRLSREKTNATGNLTVGKLDLASSF